MPKKPPSRPKAPAKKAAKPAKKAAPAKKPVAKKAPAPIVKKPVAKSPPSLSVVSSAKKPLAGAGSSAVKAAAASKAPVKPIPMIKAEPQKIAPIQKKTNMNAPVVPPNYEPSEKEEFMNAVMREYFRRRLMDWRDELLRESEVTLHVLQEEGNMQKPDITDRASEETDLAIEFRTRDRERKLLNKIIEAMERIDEGTYGFCEETGDPIPVKRLIARPTATMTLEAQELHERRERTQRDQFE